MQLGTTLSCSSESAVKTRLYVYIFEIEKKRMQVTLIPIPITCTSFGHPSLKTLDFGYPFSAVTAFGAALASVDRKLADSNTLESMRVVKERIKDFFAAPFG